MSRRFDPGELAGTANPWRTTLLLSFGLHLTGFILIVAVPRLVPRPAISPVYLVDLVALPGGPANASAPPPAAAAPPPAPKEEKAVKIPDRQKKLEPKKPAEPKSTPVKPKPAATPAEMPSKSEEKTEAKTEEPAQPQGTPAHGASMSGVTGGTGAAGGGFGGSGAVQADAMSFYYSVVQRNIENAWKKPIYPPSETGQKAFTTQIRLVLTASGRVSKVDVLAPSGYDAMDRSVLDAVHDAMFPPFPSSLSSSSLPISIEMVLTRD